MTRIDRRMVVAALVLFSALTLAAVTPAAAMSLGEAKAAGLVGERPDGYLGIVASDASAEVRSLVDGINAKRRNEYRRIAQRRGITLSQAEVVIGEQLIRRAAPGEYVMTPAGRWQRK